MISLLVTGLQRFSAGIRAAFRLFGWMREDKYAGSVAQKQLQAQWELQLARGDQPRPIETYGFSVHSQSDEDGILLYLFTVIGTTNRRCVEICAGNGIECNTANLIVHHGWYGLLFDGNGLLTTIARNYYRYHPRTKIWPPVVRHAWITRDTINDLVRDAGFSGEVDLLSLDMDGMDYWIWEALDAIQPRVVVVEFQDSIGPERAITVPYSADFNAYRYPLTDGLPNYCGASLRAFVHLGKRKGYRLVGCNMYGFNAFFVRNDLAEDRLPEVDVLSCFAHPKVQSGLKERFKTVEHLPWTEV